MAPPVGGFGDDLSADGGNISMLFMFVNKHTVIFGYNEAIARSVDEKMPGLAGLIRV